MGSLWKDLRVALRACVRHAGSSILIVGLLALGIGTSTAMFSVMRPALLGTLPYPEPDRLMYVFETDVANGERFGSASFPDLNDWRARTTQFAALAAFSRSNVSLQQTGGTPSRRVAMNVSHDMLATLQLRPQLGRGFVRDDDRVGARPVVMLSDAIWRSSYAADPEVIGSTIAVDNADCEVIGVLPPAAPWSLGGDLWRPVEPTQPNFINERSVHSLRVIGRLRPEASAAAANVEMVSIAAALEREHPEENKGRAAIVVGMHAHLVRDIQQPLWLLSAAIVVLLALTVSNAGALMMARMGGRAAEFALRASLGAVRWRLLRLLAIESLLIAAVGGLAGIAVASALVDYAAARNPVPALDAAHWQVDVVALVFAIVIALGAAVLAGLTPAWFFSRTSPARVLAGMRGAAVRHGDGIRRIIVAGQVATATLLLIAVSVLLRSQQELAGVDLGLQDEGVATMTIALPPATYPQPPQDVYPRWPEVTQFMDALAARLAAVPEIDRFGFQQNLPLTRTWTTTIEIEGRQVAADAHEEWQLQTMSPGTRATLGIALVAGRDLSERDHSDAPAVVLINEAAARTYFKDVDPVGKRVRMWGQWREVVGVIGDVRIDGVSEPVAPALHPPLAQVPFSTFSVVAHAGNGDSAALLPILRTALWSIDADVVPYNESTVTEIGAALTAAPRFALGLMGVLAIVAMVIALSGLFGLIATDVQRRRAEIGVRIALGARAGQILRAVAARSLALTATGMGIGMLLYIVAAPLLAAYVYGVPPRDITGIVVAVALFGGCTLIACLVPARKALNLDPIQVLRSE